MNKMKAYLILVGNMAESLADENLFAACVPTVKFSSKSNFDAFAALKEFLADTFKPGYGPTVVSQSSPEVHGFTDSIGADYLKTTIELSSGVLLEVKTVPVHLETT